MVQFWLQVPDLSSEMLWNGQACCEAAFLFIDSATENCIECRSSYAWLTDQAFRRSDQDLAPRMRAIGAWGGETRLLPAAIGIVKSSLRMFGANRNRSTDRSDGSRRMSHSCGSD
jgi:hypothetical protein